MTDEKKIIDLTLSISPKTRVYPGTPPPMTKVVKTHGEQGVQVSRLEIQVHAGTHMDAPRHFKPEGISIDQVDLGSLMGEAVLLDLGRPEPGSAIPAAALEPFENMVEVGDIVLLDTAYEDCAEDEKYCFLAADAAQWLVDRGIKCLGLDAPSVDPLNRTGGPASTETHPAHHLILGAGIPIIEGLCNLKSLPQGRFHFCCLPLKIADCDGSPVRALAREL